MEDNEEDDEKDDCWATVTLMALTEDFSKTVMADLAAPVSLISRWWF